LSKKDAQDLMEMLGAVMAVENNLSVIQALSFTLAHTLTTLQWIGAVIALLELLKNSISNSLSDKN
jgi:hypothetical protein